MTYTQKVNDSIPNPNRYSHPGVSGRKPLPVTIVKRALAQIDKNLPGIVLALITMALGGDREAAIYLIDRRLGKPVQQTALALSGGEELTAGLVTQLFTMLAAKRKELEGPVQLVQIEEPDNATE